MKSSLQFAFLALFLVIGFLAPATALEASPDIESGAVMELNGIPKNWSLRDREGKFLTQANRSKTIRVNVTKGNIIVIVFQNIPNGSKHVASYPMPAGSRLKLKLKGGQTVHIKDVKDNNPSCGNWCE